MGPTEADARMLTDAELLHEVAQAVEISDPDEDDVTWLALLEADALRRGIDLDAEGL